MLPNVTSAVLRRFRRGILKRVTVAVLDSGIDSSHPALRGRVVSARRYAFSADGVHIKRLPCCLNNDLNGHGTEVASVIATLAPNAEIQDYGVLKEYNRGDSRVVLQALEDAASSDAQIINLSLTINRGVEARLMKQLIDQARVRNKMIVASAENGSDREGYPADCDGVLGVLKGYFSGLRVAESLKRKRMDFRATGDLLLTARSGGGYIRRTGSSYATAVVSALCCICRGVDSAIRSDDVRQLVRDEVAGPRGLWPLNPLNIAEEGCDISVQRIRYTCPCCGASRYVADPFPFSRCQSCGFVGRRRPLLDSRLYFSILKELSEADRANNGSQSCRAQRAIADEYDRLSKQDGFSWIRARCDLAAALLRDYISSPEKAEFLRACGYAAKECQRIIEKIKGW